MKSINYLCDGYVITKGKTMIKYKDINKVYPDALNPFISISINPAYIGVNAEMKLLSLVSIDKRNNKNATVLISESEIPNLIKQLENIKIYFENYKESK